MKTNADEVTPLERAVLATLARFEYRNPFLSLWAQHLREDPELRLSLDEFVAALPTEVRLAHQDAGWSLESVSTTILDFHFHNQIPPLPEPEHWSVLHDCERDLILYLLASSLVAYRVWGRKQVPERFDEEVDDPSFTAMDLAEKLSDFSAHLYRATLNHEAERYLDLLQDR